MTTAGHDERRALSAAVVALLRNLGADDRVRRTFETADARDGELWRVLRGQIGAAALAIPERYGGAGGTVAELVAVLEPLGAALAGTPLLGSAVLAGQAVLAGGDEAARGRLLPGIAAGDTIAALVWAGADGAWDPHRPAVGAAGMAGPLHGTAHYVLEGTTADLLVVAARDPAGRVGLFEVDPAAAGVRVTDTPAMDPTLSLAEVRLDGAAGRPIAADGAEALALVRDIGAIAIAALQVGAAQRCLDLTVAHTRRRVQFGRPIGSFQALKHRMADMLVAVQTARSACLGAVWAATGDDRAGTDLPRAAATAKAWCSEALLAVAGECVQLHGGIAITWEHDAQLYLKRAHATAQLLGQPHEHRSRLADLLAITPDR